MQDKIKQIRKAVIKANPSILDLVFGCEVILSSEEYSKQPRTLKVLDKREIKGRDTIVEIYERSNNGIGLVFYEDKGHLKIIGRPIRLADVLLAIGTNKVGCDGEGNFSRVRSYEEASKRLSPKLVCKWNLRDDNLNNQSEETITFIHNLICHE